VRIRIAHAFLALSLVTLLSVQPASAQFASKLKQTVPRPDDQTIADAYNYLLSRVLVIRQEHNDLRAGAAYNAIQYKPLGSADLATPNFDVAYLEAWIAVDDGRAALLDIPEIKGRYYNVQILDEWGEVIANINQRTFSSKPFGLFALVAPGSRPWTPPEATRIELHSNKAKLIGRIELKDDPDGAFLLQRQFKLTAIGTPVIRPAPRIPMFDNNTLIGAAIFDEANAKLTSATDVAPRAAEMQQKVRAVAAYMAANRDGRVHVDRLLHEKVIPEFRNYAFAKSAPHRDHWVGGGQTGNYGADHRLRSAANYARIWANTPDEAISFLASRDAFGRGFNGNGSYILHFPANRLPESVADSSWSIVLVSIPAPTSPQRLNFNGHSPLTREKDGSLKISIGPKPVAGVPESNWLLSPAGRPFSLTLRLYAPKDSVRTGEWTPPAVAPFGEARAIGVSR
jgi:hypothetical protein